MPADVPFVDGRGGGEGAGGDNKKIIMSEKELPVKSSLEMALEDIKEGRIYAAENAEELFKQILG